MLWIVNVLMLTLPQVLHHVENQVFFTFIHSSASLNCFIFLVTSVIVVMYLNFHISSTVQIFINFRDISTGIVQLYTWLKWIRIQIPFPDRDRQALDADPDSNPAK